MNANKLNQLDFELGELVYNETIEVLDLGCNEIDTLTILDYREMVEKLKYLTNLRELVID